METKAHKAAEELIRQKENAIIELIRGSGKYQTQEGSGSGYYYYISIEKMVTETEEIQRLIEEFNLDKKLFNQTIERIYEYLMKEKHADIAARLAQKYNI